jgi:hypothetical protein
LVGGLAALGLVASGRPARAEPSPSEQTTWYGWETLTADGAAIALFVAAGLLDEAKRKSSPPDPTLGLLADAALATGIAAYVAGPPLMHIVRGNGKKTGASVALRLGLPLAGAITGFVAGDVACTSNRDQEVSCPLITGVLGFVAGGITAIVIDAAALARTPAGRAAPAVQPVVVPVAGGARFVLGGHF